ncbi:MAG: ECF-type sigma factor [Gemmatimonadaceae bacterium]
MSEAEAGTVTRLLEEMDAGNKDAIRALFPLVYDEIRKLAHRQRRVWHGDSTLDTTALVHEAYLKLVGSEHIGARTRVHFFGIAAKAMRHILCSYARERQAEKRGGEAPKLSLDALGEAVGTLSFSTEQAAMLSALDEALRRLGAVEPRLSEVVECRFFGGLTIEDTATALGVSAATVKRDWALARAWLFNELADQVTA